MTVMQLMTLVVMMVRKLPCHCSLDDVEDDGDDNVSSDAKDDV